MLPERFAKFQRETSGQKHERCADCCGVCGVKSRWRYRPTTSGLLPISGPLQSQIPERGRFRAVDCNNVPAASPSFSENCHTKSEYIDWWCREANSQVCDPDPPLLAGQGGRAVRNCDRAISLRLP